MFPHRLRHPVDKHHPVDWQQKERPEIHENSGKHQRKKIVCSCEQDVKREVKAKGKGETQVMMCI